ncbi:hypothetical protein C5Y96_19090 [Blastopirellula marina]|uniref:Uncharacterized protein n=1 Tax=Blastopirellula marina TaxID=124 RepID=A0A2S8F6R9_9BACT|nr:MULTISPECIES: hypothetical protein [Pirellulaceae]PQO27634.1 hypothetical protein C5Y96_19090 [Blastopirellula marina]RCS48172.1 hypothetical protein DTL36_19120 [Bremerella cremea]
MCYQNFDVTIIEILSLVPARISGEDKDEFSEDQPVGIMTIRLAPQHRWDSANVAITQSQLVRLRDDINDLLNHPESWLYLPSDDEQGCP